VIFMKDTTLPAAREPAGVAPWRVRVVDLYHTGGRIVLP
jgi:hypothetical protein